MGAGIEIDRWRQPLQLSQAVERTEAGIQRLQGPEAEGGARGRAQKAQAKQGGPRTIPADMRVHELDHQVQVSPNESCRNK